MSTTRDLSDPDLASEREASGRGRGAVARLKIRVGASGSLRYPRDPRPPLKLGTMPLWAAVTHEYNNTVAVRFRTVLASLA